MAATLGVWGYTGGRYNPKTFKSIPYIAPSGNSLIASSQKAQDEAKAANEARYSEILKGYEDMYSKAITNLDTYGTQAMADIANKYKSVEGGAMQDLASSGLYNSTIRPSVRSSVAKDQLSAQNRLGEDIALQKAQIGSALQQSKLQFQERREDTYPDQSMIASLLQSYGASGGGVSSGGYSGGYDMTKLGELPNYYASKIKKPSTTYDTKFVGKIPETKQPINQKTASGSGKTTSKPFSKATTGYENTLKVKMDNGNIDTLQDVVAVGYNNGIATIKFANGKIITISADKIMQ